MFDCTERNSMVVQGRPVNSVLVDPCCLAAALGQACGVLQLEVVAKKSDFGDVATAFHFWSWGYISVVCCCYTISIRISFRSTVSIRISFRSTVSIVMAAFFYKTPQGCVYCASHVLILTAPKKKETPFKIAVKTPNRTR